VFHSIKTKILFLFVVIMLSMALILIFITDRDVGRAVLEMEQKSIRNAMYLIKLNVENEYKNLLFHKISMLSERKDYMKTLSSFVIAGINDYHKMARQGVIPEADARQLALDWTEGLRYANGAHFFVYDEAGVILAHPNSALVGKNFSAVKDVKGQSLFHSMRQKSEQEGEGFATFSWDDMGVGKESRQLGYFTYYPKWNWMIGTAVQTEDIELEATKKLELIVKELKTTFAKTRIAQTGHLFVFNGAGQIVIHPYLSSQDLATAKNPATGSLLLDDFKAAAKHPDQPIEYLWKNPLNSEEDLSEYESYVEYFKTLDWYIVSVARTDEIDLPARQLVMRQTVFIAIIFAVGMFLAYLFVHRISQHLKKLTDHAKQLPAHDFASPETELPKIEQLAAKYRDEVGKLAEAFVFMETSLKQYIVDLRETTAAKERIESELSIARDIQMSILPKLFPAFPDRPEFDVYATVKPAREVGGDFYDFFFLDDDHLFFVLGDVSGKGIPASLFMAVTTAFLRATAVHGVAPDDVLARVNTKLCVGNDTCMFVTVFCGILNIRDGETFCADAGHNPPLLISNSDGVEFVHAPKSAALGVFEDMIYRDYRFILKPGDKLFLYTDGVTEATNVQDQLYSEERLKADLVELHDRSPEEIIKQMLSRIDDFARGTPQADDITMLVLKYDGWVS
jgi:phosphoserine phosphatase RsbU/P